MVTMEKGKDKVQKICDVLRKETLEPAMEEAQSIVNEAKANAAKIIEDAKAKAAAIKSESEKEIEKKQAVFKASLSQGARQSLDFLKQEITENLLNRNLASLIQKSTTSPQILSDLIQAVVKAIENEGLDTEISALIPSVVEPRAVNELLGKQFIEKLKENSVMIGSKKGGVEIKLHKENITIDLSDSALLELMTRYVRKDFHQFFFEK